jgi:1,2-diacylglycerol 3-alpha-glucosyltransferase
MNICMMTNTYLPHVGGVARSVQTFAEEFRRIGHSVLVVAPTFEGSHDPGAREEKYVVRLPALQQFNGSEFSVRIPFSILFSPTLAEYEPDIIHSHHPFLLGDTALRLAADKTAPIVFTHHTLYEDYTHYLPFDSPALKQFTVELATHYANLCDAVIAPSHSIADLIRQRGVEAPIEVIPTGVDLEAFASGNRKSFRDRCGIGQDTFVAGHVSRLAPEKNLDFLCAAMIEFLRSAPNAVFLVVGGGPKEEEMRDLFDRAQLSDRLIMAGKKSGQELYDAYSAMDLFVFSSKSETQGMVIAEAMAAGLPVVALHAFGVKEVVRNGKNGFLLPEDASEHEFARCVARLHEDPILRQQLKMEAKRNAKQFSRKASALKALGLYERIRRQTRRQRAEEKEDLWAGLMKRIEVEWGLLAEKAESLVHAIFTDNDTHP